MNRKIKNHFLYLFGGSIMLKTNRDLTRDEIIEISNQLIGKPFGQFKGFVQNKNKGMLGILIEEQGFEYKANSESAPDFPTAGLELKVTPYKRLRNNQLSAKERLVLNMINYNNESKIFEESSFWKKNKELLILFYEHLPNNDKSKFKISHQLIFKFPEKDLKVIKQDWRKINDKISNGLAHEISEGDTLYLGACTKASDSSVLTTQPFSDKNAKPRAYSLKNSYMTQLVRKHIFNSEKNEELALEMLQDYQTFEEEIINRIKQHYESSQKELGKIFEVNLEAKQANEIIISKILGLKGKISKTDEFLKANITVKTIRVEEKGNIKESMSFPSFKFEDIYKQNWEESDLYETLYSTKFLFVIFINDGEDYILKRAMFWNMPAQDIYLHAKIVWETTKKLISEGKIIREQKNGRDFTFFPDTKFDKCMHVRPHGKNKKDTLKLPVPDILTNRKYHLKQSFWFNANYIKSIINKK